MSLLRTELTRFWSRRLVWITAAIVAAVTTLGVGIAFSQHSSDVGDGSAARREAERNTERCVRDFMSPDFEADRGQILRDYGLDPEMSDAEFEQFLRRDFCYQDPAWYGNDDPRFFATEILLDSWEAKSITSWADDRPDSSTPETGTIGGRIIRRAHDGLNGVLPGVSTFFLVVAVLIGASFVGAEYKAGTVENLLLWEPRRARVLVTKFVAGFVSSFVLTFALLTWLSGLLYVMAVLRGTTDGIDGRFWIDVASTITRGSVMGGVFFVAAMSVSVVARNTTAAVGVILGWFAISNIVIELFAKWMRSWELFTNAGAFIREADGIRYQKIQGFWETYYAHGYMKAGLIAAVWALVLALIATVVFVRRDVD